MNRGRKKVRKIHGKTSWKNTTDRGDSRYKSQRQPGGMTSRKATETREKGEMAVGRK